jgi:hypothetical protein
VHCTWDSYEGLTTSCSVHALTFPLDASWSDMTLLILKEGLRVSVGALFESLKRSKVKCKSVGA